MRRFWCIAVLTLCSVSIARTQNFNTDSLLRALKTASPDSHKVDIYRNLGISVAHKDPSKAIEYWKQGLTLSKNLNYTLGTARCLVNIATGYSYLGRYDSALIYSDSAILFAKLVGDPNRLALVYLNTGDYYRNVQNFKKALLYCDTALKYASEAANNDRMARIYDIISDVYAAQKQYVSSLSYLEKALELYKKDENMQMVGQVYSDFADIYKNLDEHDKAIAHYQQAIHIGDSVQDLKNLSTYHADLCDLYLVQKNYTSAKLSAEKAMHFAKLQGNNLQLATAFTHFANLYLQQKNYGEAVEAGIQAYKLAVGEKNLLWQHESAATVANAYTALNDHKNAAEFLRISGSLNDSLRRQQFNEQTAALQTSFDVRQKDKEIELLSKDSELQQQRIIQQRFYLSASFVVAFLAIGAIALLMNRNRLRQRMKELQLRNQIAADLHDEVGSSLSSIHLLSKMAVQGKTAVPKDILNRVSENAQETMEKMSDIVWMIKPSENDGQTLAQRMERYLYELCTHQNIECSMQASALDQLQLNMHQRKNLYLIFKEAVNNSIKYSGTKKLEVSIAIQQTTLVMRIRDFGKGFNEETIIRGNGLANMQARAKELKGHLHINSSEEHGTELELKFPV
jgi:two-component system, NarL family, sensor histidine kinase UhpB